MKKEQLKWIIFLAGVLATILLFVDAFKLEDFGQTVSGFKLAFGGTISKTTLGITVELGNIKFNIIYLVILIAPALGGLIQLLLKDPIGSLLSFVFFAVAIILLVMTKETNFVGIIDFIKAPTKVKLETMAYISIAASAIGLIFSGYKITLKK